MTQPSRTDSPDNSPDGTTSKLPLPSTEASTNLLIADIVVRGASTLLRKNIGKKVVKASTDTPEEAEKILDGRSILTTLGLYGASKLATRSVPGLAIVAGGLVAKTLYDRGRARQLRIERQNREQSSD